jgi:hypothetical protein
MVIRYTVQYALTIGVCCVCVGESDSLVYSLIGKGSFSVNGTVVIRVTH